MSALCRLGIHRRRAYIVALTDWPLSGVTFRRCVRCGRLAKSKAVRDVRPSR